MSTKKTTKKATRKTPASRKTTKRTVATKNNCKTLVNGLIIAAIACVVFAGILAIATAIARYQTGA